MRCPQCVFVTRLTSRQFVLFLCECAVRAYTHTHTHPQSSHSGQTQTCGKRILAYTCVDTDRQTPDILYMTCEWQSNRCAILTIHLNACILYIFMMTFFQFSDSSPLILWCEEMSRAEQIRAREKYGGGGDDATSLASSANYVAIAKRPDRYVALLTRSHVTSRLPVESFAYIGWKRRREREKSIFNLFCRKAVWQV